jgi:hypothetical protein
MMVLMAVTSMVAVVTSKTGVCNLEGYGISENPRITMIGRLRVPL